MMYIEVLLVTFLVFIAGMYVGAKLTTKKQRIY